MSMMTTYVLDNEGKPVHEPDVLIWGAWFHNTKRHVALTEIGPAMLKENT